MIDPLAAEARRLRTVEGLSLGQIRQRLDVGRDKLHEWLRGVPPPEWTKRPNAKDELRAKAVELREHGWSVNDIALELGVAKSTAYQWVKHLPLGGSDAEAARRRREHSKRMTDARWEAHRRARDEAQAGVRAIVAQAVGSLCGRDLMLLGAAIYWCEGTKSKPWRRDDRVVFINSDPTLLALFLRYLKHEGVDRESVGFRLSIHESADAEAAIDWWVATLNLPRESFRPTTFKRHRPETVRRNTGVDYHGCLVIEVSRSRDLYWRIEATMMAVAEALDLPREGPPSGG